MTILRSLLCVFLVYYYLISLILSVLLTYRDMPLCCLSIELPLTVLALHPVVLYSLYYLASPRTLNRPPEILRLSLPPTIKLFNFVVCHLLLCMCQHLLMLLIYSPLLCRIEFLSLFHEHLLAYHYMLLVCFFHEPPPAVLTLLSLVSFFDLVSLNPL